MGISPPYFAVRGEREREKTGNIHGFPSVLRGERANLVPLQQVRTKGPHNVIVIIVGRVYIYHYEGMVTAYEVFIERLP